MGVPVAGNTDDIFLEVNAENADLSKQNYLTNCFPQNLFEKKLKLLHTQKPPFLLHVKNLYFSLTFFKIAKILRETIWNVFNYKQQESVQVFMQVTVPYQQLQFT